MTQGTNPARELYRSGNLWRDRITELALPIVLWCAKNGRKIRYGQLAEEIRRRHDEEPKARYTLYGQPAGKIGNILEALSDEWGERIPPINALVVNGDTGLPGSGVDTYLDDYLWLTDVGRLSDRDRTEMVKYVIQRVFNYDKWDKVAAHLGISHLPPVSVLVEEDLEPIPLPDARQVLGGGGESEQHRRLKEWVAAHPEVFTGFGTFRKGRTEVPILSGDVVDVLFAGSTDMLAVEVKAANVADADLVRGIFQCIKYKAVLQAMQFAEGGVPNAQTVLAVQRRLPDQLQKLAKRLQVRVIVVNDQ